MNETTKGVKMNTDLNLTPEEQAIADAWLQEQLSRPPLPKGYIDNLIAIKIKRESK
tara:strand:- start:379 stop:546 length:168 start_codon:yes stop_codon:yes gene_type:complete